MAREKRIAHRSPNSLADSNRDITSIQAELVRNQNTPEHRLALVNSSAPEDSIVPVGFAAHVVNEAQKPKRQVDLEKAYSILERRQNGLSVSWAELEWAKTLCAREAALEEAEKKGATATQTKKQQWQQSDERRIREIRAANKDSTWTSRMLLRNRLGEGDKSDSESDSDLSSVSGVSDVATVKPAVASQKESSDCEPGDDNSGGEEEEEEDAAAPQAHSPGPLFSPLDDTNSVMTAEESSAEDSEEDIWDDEVWARIIKDDKE
ncbi:hypothetical protein ACET3X_003914 [Alternaria dauci]|uniref:Uncharacterized protein n=1 Tax=Alternaria dauci TaxID=48095 RepID=A0ABR3UMN5_9PLEO